MGIPVVKEKKKVLVCGICVLMLGFAGVGGISNEKNVEGDIVGEDVKETSVFGEQIQKMIKEQVLSLCAPLFCFGVKDYVREYENFYEKALVSEVPFFSYMYESGGAELPIQDSTTWQRILANNEELPGDETSATININSEDETMVEGDRVATEGEHEETVEEAMPLNEAFEMENARAVEANNAEKTENQGDVFVPHERQVSYNMEDFQEFSALFETFYAMDSNTMVGRDELNVEALLQPNVVIDKTAPGPHILIYHTHSQETFVDSVPGDKSTTIVGAGDKLARLLTEEYGYSVLHHTGEYDVIDRDNAYSRSLPALEQILAENPSIQVIIDLHRDGVAESTKLMVDLDGRPTARFMFFNGLSRTKNTGDIDYLYNPYQQQNLALSFQMQLAVDEYYPGLARRIYLNGYRYNMHLKPSMLIELGAQTNTVEEIMNAVDPLAHVLDLVFSGKITR